MSLTRNADLRLYHVSHTFAEVGRLLSRLLAQGGSLGNRDRRLLREASTTCGQLVRCLTGPSDDLEMVEVAGSLAEVVQPIFSRPLLVEQLFRAQDALAMLVDSAPGLERVTVAPGQLAWLQEFLSECCLMLLRDLAKRQMRHHPYAVGS
jgi:hypothetical protein